MPRSDNPQEASYGSASPATPAPPEADTVLVAFTKWLVVRKHLVVGVWSVLFMACLPLVYIVVTRAALRFDPARGTPTWEARRFMESEFPKKAWENDEVIMIACDSCASALEANFTKTALQEVASKMKELNRTDPKVVGQWDSPTIAMETTAQLQKISQTLQAPPLPNAYLSKDKQTVLFHTTWQFPKGQEDQTLRAVKKLRSEVAKLDKRGRKSGFKVHLLGTLSQISAMTEETMKETMVKEAFVSPLAVLVMLLQVGSFRLAWLSGTVMCTSIVIAIGFLYLPLQCVTLTPICPLMAMVQCVALGVDYSLFMFARFREEVQAGRGIEEALYITMDSSGRVILLSGTILVCSFGFCTLYPGEAVWPMALTGTMSAFVLVCIHLTLTPCMVSMSPEFFAHGLSAEASGRDSRGSKNWFKLGSFMTSGWRPLVTMLLVYGLMAPVIWQLSTLEPSSNIELMAPRGHPAMAAVKHGEANIASGEIAPISLFVKGLQGDVRSDATFAEGCKRISQFIDSTKGTIYELSPADFTSPFAVPGAMIPVLKHLPFGGCPQLTCLRWDQPPPECPFLPSAKQMLEGGSMADKMMPGFDQNYQALWRQLVSDSNHSAMARLCPSFMQSDTFMKPFYKALESSGFDHFFGSMVITHELNTLCTGRLPLVIVLMVLVESLLIGGTFGTYLAPLKLILTVVAPVAFVFGILTCIYQHGALDFTHIDAFQSLGVFWLIPVVTSALLLGLAVDYDIFLFARVVELREAGYDNNAAVVGGLATTGPVITAAGVIMAIAYSGMLLSSVGLDCQFGFVVTFGVLLDTFVIRGFLVPCVLSVGGSVNYWPAKMPEPTRTLEDMEEYLMDRDGSSKALSCHEMGGDPKLMA